ncbi:MAG: hypothetical protein WBN22_02500, partial [Verrucomicrobiia bacterium]
DEPPTVQIRPHGPTLKAGFQVHLPVPEDEHQLVDRSFAEVGLEIHRGHSWSRHGRDRFPRAEHTRSRQRAQFETPGCRPRHPE